MNCKKSDAVCFSITKDLFEKLQVDGRLTFYTQLPGPDWRHGPGPMGLVATWRMLQQLDENTVQEMQAHGLAVRIVAMQGAEAE